MNEAAGLPTAYRGKFSGWFMPRAEGKIQVANILGPFEVEVYEDRASGGDYRPASWKARLIPTGAKFGTRGMKTAKLAMDMVRGQFQKIEEDFKPK